MVVRLLDKFYPKRVVEFSFCKNICPHKLKANKKLILGMMKSKGILSEDGTKIYAWSMWNCLETLTWLSDEALKKYCDDRDPIETPSCPYKIQPENQGKLIWLSGPPGAGKSTTGLLMGKEHGYVYYEADCTLNCLNPFVPLDSDNPTLAAFRQKPLKVSSKKFSC